MLLAVAFGRRCQADILTLLSLHRHAKQRESNAECFFFLSLFGVVTENATFTPRTDAVLNHVFQVNTGQKFAHNQLRSPDGKTKSA